MAERYVYKPSYKKTIARAYGVSVPTLSKWIRLAREAGADIQFNSRSLIPPIAVERIVNHIGDPEHGDLIRQAL